MPRLIIRIQKSARGGAVLTCTRADGSVTWQRQDGAQGEFFPLHDLTHFAVETVLGHRRGFFGLVAEGWEIGDFGSPWPRGAIPADADPSELIVGLLDAERASGARWSAAEFTEMAERFCAQRGAKCALRLTDDELARVRALRDELLARWAAMRPGEAMELLFGGEGEGEA